MRVSEPRIRSQWRRAASPMAVLAMLLSLPAAALAEDGPHPPNERTFSSGYKFVELSGEEASLVLDPSKVHVYADGHLVAGETFGAAP